MMTRCWRALAGLCAALAGAVTLGLAAMVAWSITGRTLGSGPVQGDVELMQVGIALAISLSLPWCQLHRAHLIVDFFTQRLAPRGRDRLDAVGALLLAATCALLAWRSAAGAQAVRAAGEETMILGLPMWWAYAMLAPGLALSAAIAAWQAQRLWRGLAAAPEGDVPAVADLVVPTAPADGSRPS
ncbi:TRAP transporter small permease [Pseudaquabacterium rugosum]|uniref:TRAP transporter small permease protein n=1 Tax=Pseudaquabacterium rugosum TaxID=2984194 RepID=A0ABU9B675_9BURK